MGYNIFTGCFERGSYDQQRAFIKLLGEDNIQYKFDLYFHWYNIAHEFGHCLLDMHGSDVVGVRQELLVNKFAVSYWKERGFDAKLAELKKMLEKSLEAFPCPVPPGEDFIEWYESIWNSNILERVDVYGYLQFKSVLMAMEEAQDLGFWLAANKIRGFSLPFESTLPEYPITADTAYLVLADLMSYLDDAGVAHPDVTVELIDDPSKHYCRPA